MKENTNNRPGIWKKLIMSVLSVVLIFGTVLVFDSGLKVEAKSTPSKVKKLCIEKYDYNYIKLKWKKAKRAKRYIVYSAVGKGKYKKLAKVKTTTFKDKKVKNLTTYRYYVRGYNGKLGKKSNAVKIKTRAKVIKSWYIGGNGKDYYDKYLTKKVKATLYTDGLMKISGKGDTARFYTSGPPWLRDTKVWNVSKRLKRVKMAKSVRPTSMSGWFFGCEKLNSAPVIPNSVKELNGTFYGCKSLKKAPAIPYGVEDMHNTFENCTSLKAAPVLPSSVEWFLSTFENCKNMTKAANIPSEAKIKNAWNMYRGCKKLTGKMYVLSPIGTVLGFFENAVTTPGTKLEIIYHLNNAATKETAMKIFNTKSSNSHITISGKLFIPENILKEFINKHKIINTPKI